MTDSQNKKPNPLNKIAKALFEGSGPKGDTDQVAPPQAETTVFARDPQEETDQASTGTNTETSRFLPANQLILPVIPIREGVLFPSTESVLTFGREVSINAINSSVRTRKMVALVSQKKSSVENPKPEDLYTIGTLAIIDRTLKVDNQVNALVRGVGRIKILRFVKTEPALVAQVVKIEDIVERDDELTALSKHLQKEFRKAVQMGKAVEFLNFMKLMSGVSEGELADQIASSLSANTKDKQEVLEAIDVKQRIKLVIGRLSHEKKVLEIEKDVAHKTQAKFDKHMKESVLRERLRTIQKELGEFDDEEEISDEYQKKLKKLKAPQAIKEKIAKELKKLKQLSVNNPEAGYVRSWLDTVFELPWGNYNQSTVDLKKAEKILDESHYGLPKVKERILEHMAVIALKQQAKKAADQQMPTILCFVGPPGVGKTSIGKSIAQALEREFVKVSLGGIRDEAEIRGHRRTYVGAMPGRIINGLRQVKTANPVFMLDEIDKVGADFRGDPSAALLEALDPEQNNGFEDHYLDMAFDLSQILFITTANTLDTIPPALRDRLEIIRYAGYTQEEKFFIAKKYLVEKTSTSNGLVSKEVSVDDAAIEYLISRYTREAGVRSLERQFGKIMRKLARKKLETSTKATKKTSKVTKKSIPDLLGPEPFDETMMEAENQVGLATGLAWTSVGGDVLFIEVALSQGKGVIQLTGQLGDVMKESAQAAFTFVKSNAALLGIEYEKMSKTDVHVHVPEGAVPKDGPSAGITMTTAIISAFTNIPIKKDVAMTGEVTLRGRVMRIGGLKEKSIAAHRAGIKTILIPKDNERDLVEIPDSVKKNITFKPVAHVSEVLKLALTKQPKPI
jgi:ATP-dependent Lon protease